MAITESFAPPGLSYYVWWFPGSPVKVHLALDVVRRLREQLQLAGPKAAGEGLLFGKTIEGATEVLDFQPAVGSVPEAVATLAKDGGKPLLVGYYRTETGDSLRLNENDLALARTSFGQPYHVFLLIQPTGFGPPNATFFFHDSDGKMAEFSLMEFPFEPALLAGEERDRIKRSQEAAARRSAALQPPPAPTLRPGRRLRVAVAAVALLALLAGGVGIAASSRPLQQWWSRLRVARGDSPATAQPVPTLSALAMGLRARRENADVEITWNRESPVVAAAISGVLSIKDGNLKRDIPLDAAQVRNSSVVYSPSSDQVSIQLSVTTQVSTVMESIMLLLPNSAEPPKQSPLPVPKAPAARPLKPFTPPSAAVTRTEAGMPALPLLTQGPGAAANPEFIPTLIAQPSASPPSEQLAGASPNAPGSLAEAVPAGSQAAVYHPAEPLHRVVPRFPPQLLTMMTKPGSIDVRVTIDKAGRVTKAEAGLYPGVHKLVMEKIIAAARSWTFKPARRGNDPISSEYLLQFNFGR